ncbi:MAG: DUF1295 domain-containing protein [Cyanobacteriota bacterium]|nr:DUF1295 domain-containing protein [Cyanobacteriota bacterium]
MKVKHIVNLHKGSTFFFVLGLMGIYNNFTLGPLVYLALHGTYGFLWLLKDRLYPDRQWEQEVPIAAGVVGFVVVSLYWVAPFILISSGSIPTVPLVAIAIALNVFGVFLHFGSDAQKYYTLKYQPGLITEGFFARCRNPNYLGEVLIYSSFALLVQHWLPWVIFAGFFSVLFVPNMLKKDRSLSRYQGFEEYKANSGLILPKLWGNISGVPLPQENQL